MKLELVKYTCAACSHAFLAPEIGASAYGEFLLRTNSGQVAYLDALNDGSYKEVSRLIGANPKVARLSAIERSSVLRRIYGEVACDRAEDGGVFVIGARPLCPNCGSPEMKSWEAVDPPKFVDIPIESVSHRDWMRLSDAEREVLVDRVIV